MTVSGAESQVRFLTGVIWLLGALLVVVLVGGPYLVWRVADRDGDCERAGGVSVRSVCIDRDAVIEP